MFKDNLKRFRADKNLKQKELAEMLGVSHGAISSWEIGRTEPNMGMVEKIAEVLGVTKSALMGLDNPVDGSRILSGKEKVLIDMVRQMSEDKQSKLYQYAISLLVGEEVE